MGSLDEERQNHLGDWAFFKIHEVSIRRKKKIFWESRILDISSIFTNLQGHWKTWKWRVHILTANQDRVGWSDLKCKRFDGVLSAGLQSGLWWRCSLLSTVGLRGACPGLPACSANSQPRLVLSILLSGRTIHLHINLLMATINAKL